VFVALHLISLVVMAGTTFIDFITLRSFWKFSVSSQAEKAVGVLETTASFSRIAGIGAALLIVTGLLMMVITRGVFGEQLWFRIKFALVLLLIANSLFIGRTQNRRLRKTVISGGLPAMDSMGKIRKALDRFFLSQLLLFIVIIFLSIFKFN
ncbi:MAG TPA: hypothetical protein VFI33_10295, partial [Puia sp.]|nr:hypothetical protein [Puia sp.]